MPMEMSSPIPRLRHDLEVQKSRRGTVDVRDPHLRQVFTIEVDEHLIASAFDGERTAEDVARRLSNGTRVTPRQVLRVAEELEQIGLLDTPEVWEREPVVDNASPYSLIETTRRRLRVLPEAQPEARWSCGACGECCHGLAVEVSEEEERRIDPALYPDLLGDGGFVEEAFVDPDQPAARVLRHRDDGGCIFLLDNGLCGVHARQGMSAKPDACQLFPHVVVQVPEQKPRLALRVNCLTMHESHERGRPTAADAEHVMRVHETSPSYRVPKTVPFFGEDRPFGEVDALRVRIDEVFAPEGVTPKALARIDAELLDGRVRRARRAYGRRMRAYLDEERDGDLEVAAGALWDQVRRLRRGLDALSAMKAGRRPPPVTPRVAVYLARQMANALYSAGPMNLPDAGFGHVALMLALEATLHAVGPRGRLSTATRAFMVFTGPVLETTAHAWPALDAIDEAWTDRLRAELL